MAGSKLYVGNLSYSVTKAQLEELFSSHGEVKEVTIIEGRGFGFVEMSTSSEAESAQEALDGADFQERALRVQEARPQRSGGGGGGGGGGGRGGGGGGRGRRDGGGPRGGGQRRY